MKNSADLVRQLIVELKSGIFLIWAQEELTKNRRGYPFSAKKCPKRNDSILI